MKNKLILMMITFLLFIVGCATNDSSSKEQNSYPINYETKSESDQMNQSPDVDYTYYKQSQRRMEEFKGTDTQHPDTDIYTDEETDRVTEYLEGDSKILNAQVASTNDRIIVAVMLSERGTQEVGNEIEREVRKIVQDKEIVVYTDYTYWEQMNDATASEEIVSMGKNAEEFLKNFFNVETEK